MSEERPLALTMGEPAGVGGEITLKAWAVRRDLNVPPFFIIDDPSRLHALAQRLGLEVPICPIDQVDAALSVFETGLPVRPHPLPGPVRPGHPDLNHSLAVIGSIERAVALVRAGAASAVVTNPIQKSVLHQAGFAFPGHTEYLAMLAGMTTSPVMMLEGGGLRVVAVTIHIALREVVVHLTTDVILHAARVAAQALQRDFGFSRPRLAMAGLNPHAGEDGSFGHEEIDIITPAVRILQDEGWDVVGPRPADTLFHSDARQTYDAVLCMYHDQALIPLKTLAFDSGVNITLGLPFVRTSPDHGTALDIAGKGKAHPTSLIAALKSADRMVRARAVFDAR